MSSSRRDKQLAFPISNSLSMACNKLYDQCGGQDFKGGTCCTDSTCKYSNPYYSQCLPTQSTGDFACGKLYDQCGGKNWKGSTCCTSSVCQFQNDYYSQCLIPKVVTSKTSTHIKAPVT